MQPGLAPGGDAAARSFHLFELLFHFRFAFLLASCGPGHLDGLLPRGDSLGMLAQCLVDLPEVVVDLDVLAFLVLNRLLKVWLGFLVFFLFLYHPSPPFTVSSLVLVFPSRPFCSAALLTS